MSWLKEVIYHRYFRVPRFVLLKVYVLVMFGYCIVPFVLLSNERYIQASITLLVLADVGEQGRSPMILETLA